MFADWNGRKRGREDDWSDYDFKTGFAEHRTKRHITALPHRTSPNINRQPTPPTFPFTEIHVARAGHPTITPADSESEGTPTEPKSFFSPYSSEPGDPLSQSSSPYIISSQATEHTQRSDSQLDDFDMMDDAMHLSPSASQTQDSPSITGRIPTPIHSSFAPFIRAEKASLNREDHFADDEALVNRFKRGRRLPSPISEGEMSPSVLAESMGDMQMEVDKQPVCVPQEDTVPEIITPMKKGHTRSKHSLRQWSGYGGDLQSAGAGVRRSFSMGYRADCEKCRLKVPGHFSHIITYGD